MKNLSLIALASFLAFVVSLFGNNDMPVVRLKYYPTKGAIIMQENRLKRTINEVNISNDRTSMAIDSLQNQRR